MPNRKLTAIIFLSIFFIGCATVQKAGPSISSLEPTKIGGINYVELNSFREKLGVQFDWDFITKSGTLKKDDTNLKFHIDSNVVLINELPKKLEAPAILSQGAIYLPQSLAEIFKERPKFQTPAIKAPGKIPKAPSRYRLKSIVIDPGHGGKDPGAIGRAGLKEKELVLGIAKKVRDILEAEGLEIILTRSDDTFISLWQRARIAEAAKADLFISIHANASRKKFAHGFEIYYFPEQSTATSIDSNDIFSNFENREYLGDSEELRQILWDLNCRETRRESIELASEICDSVGTKIPVKNRGIKCANFYVLKKSIMPSILIEVGFISNPKEESMFRSSEYNQLLAENIAKGILSYKEVFEATDGFTE